MGYISPLNHSEIGLVGTNLAKYLAPPCKYMTDSSPKYVEHVVKPASLTAERLCEHLTGFRSIWRQSLQTDSPTRNGSQGEHHYRQIYICIYISVYN